MCRIGKINVKGQRYHCNGHGNSYFELTVRVTDQVTKKNLFLKKGLKESDYREWVRITKAMNEDHEHYLIQCAIYCN